MKAKKSGSSEVNLATVLICIVIVFLFCHIPRVILNCAEFFMVEEMFRCPDTFYPSNWNLCLVSLNHWLLIINSSSNFLIYCSMGESFKMALTHTWERYGKCSFILKPYLKHSSYTLVLIKILRLLFFQTD